MLTCKMLSKINLFNFLLATALLSLTFSSFYFTIFLNYYLFIYFALVFKMYRDVEYFQCSCIPGNMGFFNV